MLRSIVAIIAGYAIFALATAALFLLSGRDPHAAAPLSFVITGALVGAVAAFAGGMLAASIAKRKPITHASVISLLLATAAVVTLLTQPASDSVWSQLSVLLLASPMPLFGAWLVSRRRGAAWTWDSRPVAFATVVERNRHLAQAAVAPG